MGKEWTLQHVLGVFPFSFLHVFPVRNRFTSEGVVAKAIHSTVYLYLSNYRQWDDRHMG